MGRIYPGKKTAFEFLKTLLQKESMTPHEAGERLWRYWGAYPRKYGQHVETAKQAIRHMKHWEYSGGMLAEHGLILKENSLGCVRIRELTANELRAYTAWASSRVKED